MSVFGPVVTKGHVEQAVIDTLQMWLPTYVAEVERQSGRTPGELPDVRSWSTVNRFIQRPQDQLPSAIVISPGLASKPEKRAGGRYSAWWRIGIALLVTANTQEAANDNAGIYAAALRMLLVHKSSLGGFAVACEWVDENSDQTPADYLEIGSVLQVDFNVLVMDVVVAGLGPTTVPDDPTADPDDWGLVQSVEIQTKTESLT